MFLLQFLKKEYGIPLRIRTERWTLVLRLCALTLVLLLQPRRSMLLRLRKMTGLEVSTEFTSLSMPLQVVCMFFLKMRPYVAAPSIMYLHCACNIHTLALELLFIIAVLGAQVEAAASNGALRIFQASAWGMACCLFSWAQACLMIPTFQMKLPRSGP